MSDEGNDKKTSKRTSRIQYERCNVCGARKKEQDMIKKGLCTECYEKMFRRKDGYWHGKNRGGDTLEDSGEVAPKQKKK